jgi:hypothetical protein
MIQHYKKVHIKEKKETFKCDLSLYENVSKLYIIGHMDSKHLGTKYNCNQCAAIFSTRHYLSKHVRRTHININT